MISIETEARVARLLLSLAEGERTVEISRQVLSDNFDFDAYQVFKFLDVECKNRVDSINIVDFLRSKGTFASNCEAQLTVLFYDQDGDGTLSYCEFLNLVQSEKSIRRNNPYPKSDKLSFNVEYSLGKLLEKELSLSKQIMGLLSDLKLRCDFNVHDIYHLLKGWNCITSESIKAFLERNSVNYLESDIKAIMKRLDFNRDGRIDICELHAFLGFPNCGRCCPCSLSCGCRCCSCCCCSVPCCKTHCSSPRCRSRSPLRRSQSPLKENDKFKNSITNANSSTLYQTGTPNRSMQMSQNQMGETRLSPNLSLRQSPERRYSPRNGCSPRRCGSPLRHSCTANINTNINTIQTNNTPSYEQTQFVDYLRMVMDAESRIEKAKIDLALRPDFNVEDAFRIFELDGRGFITEDDLKYGLNVLEIYPTCSDVRLLMKRFDLQKEGVLNFADFFDMVTPYEKDYRSMVENRPPNSCCACRCPDVFMCTTRVYLKNLFNILIDYENKFNCAKRGYTNLRFKLREVFRGLDKFDFGYFNENDLANYLKKNYAFTSTKDSDLLFIRLDRNRNGKVEYWEMEEELAQVI